MEQVTTEERYTRLVMLLVILAVFLVLPLRIIGYGYMPIDDALRHSAFAMGNRSWGDLILLDSRFPAWMDVHPGWHTFLRAIHDLTQWDQGTLVTLSVVMAFWVFTFTGVIASSNAPAWILGCTLVALLEPGLLGKLLLGRPLFFSMTAVMALLFLWTRPRPLRLPHEIGVVALVLGVSLYMHPSSWYLWLIALPPLVACRSWRAIGALAAGWGIALAATCLLNGWYNAIVLPIDVLRLALLEGGAPVPLLATELQPTGAPMLGLMGMAVTLVARRAAGHDVRHAVQAVDFAFVVTAWIAGLYVGRFWVEWGLPAMAVWFTRQLAESLEIGFVGGAFQRRTAGMVGISAVVLFLSQSADLGGRYSNTLRNPLMTAPVSEFASDLPDPGGILYSPDMGTFYTIFHRIPTLQFRFSTAMEPGLMPAADLKVLRAIQSSNLSMVREYQPWFDKMTMADRVMIRSTTEPEWPGLVFKRFYGAWIGHKAKP